MLNERIHFGSKILLLALGVALFGLARASSVAPVLDIEDEARGYMGAIGEHNVLVQLTPQLQIKNIEEISNTNQTNSLWCTYFETKKSLYTELDI